MMAEYKETVERRYFTVTGQVPEEEGIERIVSNGDSEDLPRKAIKEHGRAKVLATVHEIKDRHDAAVEVEKSLLELHQVFLDMAVMVDAYDEQMDQIEHHVAQASHYVKEGTKELKTDKHYQRSSRKWLCIGLVLMLILILVIWALPPPTTPTNTSHRRRSTFPVVGSRAWRQGRWWDARAGDWPSGWIRCAAAKPTAARRRADCRATRVLQACLPGDFMHKPWKPHVRGIRIDPTLTVDMADIDPGACSTAAVCLSTMARMC